MLGPLIELELPDDSETVPEGLKIAPVHFLSPPTDERFRNFIEGDKHEHHIVKIVQKKEGYEVEIIDSFIEIREKFCFETEKFSNKSLCFITTVFMGFGEKPFCSHGAQIRFAVSQITAKCPHQKGALELHAVCKSMEETFLEKLGDVRRTMFTFPADGMKLDTFSAFKLKTNPGDSVDGKAFSFSDLCRESGIKLFGNLPRDITEGNCKEDVDVEFNIWKFDREWGNILQLDQILPKCSHDHTCDLSTLLSRSRRKETNTSNVQLTSVGRLLSDPDDNANRGSTTFVIQGNVGNVGSMGGQGQNTNRLSTSSTPNTRDSMIRRGYENMTNCNIF